MAEPEKMAKRKQLDLTQGFANRSKGGEDDVANVEDETDCHCNVYVRLTSPTANVTSY